MHAKGGDCFIARRTALCVGLGGHLGLFFGARRLIVTKSRLLLPIDDRLLHRYKIDEGAQQSCQEQSTSSASEDSPSVRFHEPEVSTRTLLLLPRRGDVHHPCLVHSPTHILHNAEKAPDMYLISLPSVPYYYDYYNRTASHPPAHLPFRGPWRVPAVTCTKT